MQQRNGGKGRKEARCGRIQSGKNEGGRYVRENGTRRDGRLPHTHFQQLILPLRASKTNKTFIKERRKKKAELIALLKEKGVRVDTFDF